VKKTIGRTRNNAELFSQDLVRSMGELREEADRWREKAEEFWNKDEAGEIRGDFNRLWSGKNLYEMAKGCGQKWAYVVPYQEFCASTHASVDDVLSYFDIETREFGQFFEHCDIPLVMYEGIRSYWILSRILVDAFDVDLVASLEDFWERVNAVEEPEKPNKPE